MTKTFEKYLEQVCFEANPQVLDDDMPDFFDDWLGSQDGEDYIRLADEYANKVREEERERIEATILSEPDVAVGLQNFLNQKEDKEV